VHPQFKGASPHLSAKMSDRLRGEVCNHYAVIFQFFWSFNQMEPASLCDFVVGMRFTKYESSLNAPFQVGGTYHANPENPREPIKKLKHFYKKYQYDNDLSIIIPMRYG
jgi:hypothetical protein